MIPLVPVSLFETSTRLQDNGGGNQSASLKKSYLVFLMVSLPYTAFMQ
jgi:hypothetical protein